MGAVFNFNTVDRHRARICSRGVIRPDSLNIGGNRRLHTNAIHPSLFDVPEGVINLIVHSAKCEQYPASFDWQFQELKRANTDRRHRNIARRWVLTCFVNAFDVPDTWSHVRNPWKQHSCLGLIEGIGHLPWASDNLKPLRIDREGWPRANI